MAQRCTIPCSISGVEMRIRTRSLQDTLAPQTPVLLAALVLLLASPILIAVATWEVALIAAIFFALAFGVVLGRGVLETIDFVRLGVPAELDRIIDEHEGEIFPARLAEFRERALALMYDVEDYRGAVNRFLEELRIATGEAFRCPCRKRKLPIPLPLPF